MNKLFLMVGPPAAGKTTFVQKHLNEDTVWISRDEVRFEIVPESDDYFSQEDRVFKEWIKRIGWALQSGFDVYADATHLNSKSRSKTISFLNSWLKHNKIHISYELYAIVLDTPYDICQERNNKRTGRRKVLNHSLRNMYNAYYPPTLQEGFKEIYEIKLNGEIQIIKEND